MIERCVLAVVSSKVNRTARLVNVRRVVGGSLIRSVLALRAASVTSRRRSVVRWRLTVSRSRHGPVPAQRTLRVITPVRLALSRVGVPENVSRPWAGSERCAGGAITGGTMFSVGGAGVGSGVGVVVGVGVNVGVGEGVGMGVGVGVGAGPGIRRSASAR